MNKDGRLPPDRVERETFRHSWNVTPKEAVQIQRELMSRVNPRGTLSRVEFVAGVDVHIKNNLARAAIAVLSYPELELVSRALAESEVTFPYIPGLLTFREGPVISMAWERLTVEPDVLIFDGQGIAHPRRLGIAAHMGLLLNRPTVGCAKTRLCGEFREPALEKGSWSSLTDKGETIGAVVRTRTGVKPVFVSPGHLIDIRSSIDLVLGCCRCFRLPETTRFAHRLAGG